jgi:hypothetical protein
LACGRGGRLKQELILDLSAKRKPTSQYIVSEHQLKILDLSPIPNIHLNPPICTLLGSFWYALNSKKGMGHARLDFMESSVVKFEQIIREWPKASPTIISPTHPAEIQVIIQRI